MVLHYSWKDDFWEKSGYNKGNSLKHRTIKLIIQNSKSWRAIFQSAMITCIGYLKEMIS